MSQRLLDNTKWLWCLIAIQTGSIMGQTHSAKARSPPGSPTTVEAQAKFFQDFFSVQLSPYKMEFGHVCEDADTWEQRYEKKDFKNHRDMGKVRWGDKKGGYGEHYWDLNHAGHADDHGDDGYEHDDGSYHDSGPSDPYDEPNDNSHNYSHDDYDPDKSSYEVNGRAKRAHPKTKIERKHQRHSETYEEESRPLKRRNKDELQATASNLDEEYTENDDEDEQEEEEERSYEKQKPKRLKHKKQNDYQQESNHQQPKEKKQVVLVVSEKDDADKQKQLYQPQYSKKKLEPSQYLSKKQSDLAAFSGQQQPALSQYVPYEGGAGVRQYLQPEVSAATTVPRLFLEPSTGHVVDRTTGQAYVLQPIIAPINYN